MLVYLLQAYGILEWIFNRISVLATRTVYDMSAQYSGMVADESGGSKYSPGSVEVRAKNEERPKTVGVLILSVIGCCCCCPLGIIAVILAGTCTVLYMSRSIFHIKST